MNQPSASIELYSLAVAAGDNLAGRVLKDQSAPAPLAALTLELLWRTSGLARSEEKVVESLSLSPSGTQETPFQLKVPAAGPISYAGKTFSITWCVRIASATPTEKTFTVVPASRRA
jgi:hypothetical protein